MQRRPSTGTADLEERSVLDLRGGWGGAEGDVLHLLLLFFFAQAGDGILLTCRAVVLPEPLALRKAVSGEQGRVLRCVGLQFLPLGPGRHIKAGLGLVFRRGWGDQDGAAGHRLLLEREDELGRQQRRLPPGLPSVAETRARPDPDGGQLRAGPKRGPHGRAGEA